MYHVSMCLFRKKGLVEASGRNGVMFTSIATTPVGTDRLPTAYRETSLDYYAIRNILRFSALSSVYNTLKHACQLQVCTRHSTLDGCIGHGALIRKGSPTNTWCLICLSCTRFGLSVVQWQLSCASLFFFVELRK